MGLTVPLNVVRKLMADNCCSGIYIPAYGLNHTQSDGYNIPITVPVSKSIWILIGA